MRKFWCILVKFQTWYFGDLRAYSAVNLTPATVESVKNDSDAIIGDDWEATED